MFQQIVYTRCKPRRELLDVSTDRLSDGKVVNEEGYAIHNFSEGILSEDKVYDPLFLETLLKKKNAAKEMGSNSTGIFSSYEYFYNTNGDSFLGHEYLRPYNVSDVRANGQKHRPGNYIKQYLVGKYEDYPCIYFGNTLWTAHNETENFYYHDNDEPLEYLPEIDEKVDSIVITRDKVKQFIADGRGDCVKNLVASVIVEMSKDIEDRKFIVIKDEPKNVEMWIAAVEYSLPIYLAKQISFSTNVVASQNLSMDNSYYVDSQGKYIKGNQKDAKEGGGKKAYYSMIVGIHPTAQGSSSISAGMNNVSFIYLDGQTKNIEVNNSNSTTMQYFEAVKAMDEDISDFDKLLDELAELSFANFSADIYELFDAYKYLLDSSSSPESWDYSKIKRYLAIFKKYEKAPYKWSQYLSEKTYSVYHKLFDQDFKEEFALLRQIITMDHKLNIKDSIETYLIEKYLCEIKTYNIDVSYATGLNKLINSVFTDISSMLADEFNKSIDTFIDLAEKWNSEQAYYIFEKLYESNNIGYSNVEWHKEEKKKQLIELLFAKISENSSSSSEMLLCVKNAPIYLEIATKGARLDFDSWSRYICDSVVDSKLEMVCGALLDIDSITEKQYEAFLIMLMKAGKQTNVLFKFVIKSIEKYGLKEDSSIEFVKEYLDKFTRRWNDIKILVDVMSENDFGEKTESYAYEAITEAITENSIDNSLISLAKEYEKWRMGLKQPQGRAYNIVFAESLLKRSTNQVIEVLDKYLAKEPLEVSDVDMKFIMESLDSNAKEQEVFIKLYGLIKNNSNTVKKQLVSFDFENADSVSWYLRLFLTRPISDWENEYRDEVKEIEKAFYEAIREDSIDKVEKLVIKSLDKDSFELKEFKEYFDKLRSQVKEDRAEEKQKAKEAKKEAAEEKQKAKEAKKEAADNSEKKGLFGKLFGKK